MRLNLDLPIETTKNYHLEQRREDLGPEHTFILGEGKIRELEKILDAYIEKAEDWFSRWCEEGDAAFPAPNKAYESYEGAMHVLVDPETNKAVALWSDELEPYEE